MDKISRPPDLPEILDTLRNFSIILTVTGLMIYLFGYTTPSIYLLLAAATTTITITGIKNVKNHKELRKHTKRRDT